MSASKQFIAVRPYETMQAVMIKVLGSLLLGCAWGCRDERTSSCSIRPVDEMSAANYRQCSTDFIPLSIEEIQNKDVNTSVYCETQEEDAVICLNGNGYGISCTCQVFSATDDIVHCTSNIVVPL